MVLLRRNSAEKSSRLDRRACCGDVQMGGGQWTHLCAMPNAEYQEHHRRQLAKRLKQLVGVPHREQYLAPVPPSVDEEAELVHYIHPGRH